MSSGALSWIQNTLEEIAKSPAQAKQLLATLFCQNLLWEGPRRRGAVSLTLPQSILSSAVYTERIAEAGGVPLYFIEWPERKAPGMTARRAVRRALSATATEHVVCYFCPKAQHLAFTWARKRTDGKIELRTLPFDFGSAARTTIERLAELAFVTQDYVGDSIPFIQVLDKLNRAFSVEAVTEKFFEDYQKIFEALQRQLYEDVVASRQQGAFTGENDIKLWAHDYALQCLNRIMFLYFIQRKGWLGGDRNFLANFWRSYQKNKPADDRFFEDWLKVLFFEAFNGKGHGGFRNFPDEVRKQIIEAPYLNGGLFRENELDRRCLVTITDEFFRALFDEFDGSQPGFFERYNFTISESTPLDVEVAVDPEMIGKVYESLVNVTEAGLAENDQRGKAGIFYTPRVEIDVMCRLAVVDALCSRVAQHGPPETKALLYQLVFAVDPEEKEAADRALREACLWPKVSSVLRTLTVCDPACGSGSFLVGMLLVLDDLQARASAQLGTEETPYERRRRIIGEQLYGVDVMDWAVHVAELRLWLQLVVETELSKQQLHMQPLLPNLSFKVRRGDSLVQEVGGIDFHLHRHSLPLSDTLRRRLNQLKNNKLEYYHGKGQHSEEDLKREELELFRQILENRIHQLENKIAGLRQELQRHGVQHELPGMGAQQAQAVGDDAHKEEKKRIQELEAECASYRRALEALRTIHDVPFVWDIAFVEIFSGDEPGFDIVIGNPPYVRQEKIAPPDKREDDYSPDEWRRLKAEYKEKLQRSVAMAWPKYFEYHPASGRYRKLDGRSDLYVYFYFHGLSLLNSQGSFCFITSNSWLDVGYGAELQEFLLKHCHVKLILDNEAKRSFAQADVNTVIVLLSAANDETDWGLEQLARFVMFKVPFEDAVGAETFIKIEQVTDRLATPSYRVVVRRQRELREEGLASDEGDDSDELAADGGQKKGKSSGPLIKIARYLGNKWGGKYLRAPDIYFTILEKGKGKLVRLGDIAEVRRGFTTGANEFFYLRPVGKTVKEVAELAASNPTALVHVRNAAGWEGEIEAEFLRPVIKSPRECRRILIRPEELHYLIFMCHQDKGTLRGTAALEYILWGETQCYHEGSTCKGRKRWWDVGMRKFAPVLWPMMHNDRPAAFWNESRVAVDHNLFEIIHPDSLEIWCALISSLQVLFRELYGRSNLGQGALKTEGVDIVQLIAVKPKLLKVRQDDIRQALKQLALRHIMPLQSEVVSSDRRALDNIVFRVLGLTPGERDAVYEAVISLVEARLKKAKSVGVDAVSRNARTHPARSQEKIESAEAVCGRRSPMRG